MGFAFDCGQSYDDRTPTFPNVGRETRIGTRSNTLPRSNCCPLTIAPKIGAVSYLNTRPLVAGLEGEFERGELVFDLPSRLATSLARGELDVALIPSIEAAANSDYRIVSDACIGCAGEVWSVKLLSRVPAAKIRTLAMDAGSRTSRALCRVILAHRDGVTPEISELPIDSDWRGSTTDAVLIIGDRAMNATEDTFPHQWDLGTAWNQWTGLPFVFALWVARGDDGLSEIGAKLSAARDCGIANIAEIAKQSHAQYGLSYDQCFRYLDHHLNFFLGDAERKSLALFYQYASELKLLPASNRLNFHDCQTA